MKIIKNCLERAQIENKTNNLEKNKIDVDNLKEHKKKFIKIKLILKGQQRFRNEKHDVLTKEIVKVALSSNNDKRILMKFDRNYLIEAYAHGTSKNLVCKKEEINSNNII